MKYINLLNPSSKQKHIFVYNLIFNSIQFKFICIALFTIQSLQSALQEIKFVNPVAERHIISIAVVPSKQKLFVTYHNYNYVTLN